MARTEPTDDYAALEIRTWEEALADALETLDSPPSALRAFSAVAMLGCFKEQEAPETLRSEAVILAACEELDHRDPETTVARAVESEAGELAEERKADVWYRWSADAAAFSAMKRVAAVLGLPFALLRPLERAQRVVRGWERAIRCRWHELAPYGIDLARAQLSAWREGGDFFDATLFDELAEFARSPADFRVCAYGFGDRDAADHAFLAEDSSEFGRHLSICPVCEERVSEFASQARAVDVVEPADATGAGPGEVAWRVIWFERPTLLAAASGSEVRSAAVETPSVGEVRVTLNPAGVLLVQVERPDGLRSVEVGGRTLEWDEELQCYAISSERTEGERLWQADIVIRMVDEKNSVVLRHR